MAAILLAIANNGLVGGLMKSTDGKTWAQLLTAPADTLVDICYGNALWVALGTNQVWVSGDAGATWASHALPNARTWISVSWIAFAAKFIAIAGGGGTSNMSAYSSDGSVWTASNAAGFKNWRRSIDNGSRICTCGDSPGNPVTIMTSIDAISWANVSSANGGFDYVDIAYGAGVFCALSAQGHVMVSATGSAGWVESAPAGLAGQTWARIAYDMAANLFIAVGASGAVATSSDGTNWTIRAAPNGADLNAIVACGGTSVAVGALHVGGIGSGFLSASSQNSDVTWTANATPIDYPWFALAWNGVAIPGLPSVPPVGWTLPTAADLAPGNLAGIGGISGSQPGFGGPTASDPAPVHKFSLTNHRWKY